MSSDKEDKKKAILRRNRKLQNIMESIRMLKRGTQPEIMAPELEKQPEQKEISDEEILIKMQQVRNKMTGKRRAATERWNRFSGTSSGGARGL